MKWLLSQGKLVLPNKDEFYARFDTTTVDLVESMLQSLLHIYLLKGPKGSTSTTYWAEKVVAAEGVFKDFNRMLRVLSLNGWVTVETSTKYHWSELRINEAKIVELVGEEELLQLRITEKTKSYQPKWHEATGIDNLVRQNGKTKRTGLVRKGFAAAAETQFYYDSAKLNENLEAVISNVNRGMRMCRELRHTIAITEADYDSIADAVVRSLANSPQLLNLGDSISDSRGRAIKKAVSTVANPIGYKDFRALITIPKQ